MAQHPQGDRVPVGGDDPVGMSGSVGGCMDYDNLANIRRVWYSLPWWSCRGWLAYIDVNLWSGPDA